MGVTSPSCKKQVVTETRTNENQITHLVEEGAQAIGTMTRPSQTRKEAGKLTHLLTPRNSILMGTWNIRTMFQAGKAATVSKELERYNLSVLGLAETRWTQSGEVKLASGQSIIYSGHEQEGAIHTEGVAIMMTKDARKALTAWKPISSRIISATFNTNNRRVKAHIIQCYAPTNDADDEVKARFYDSLNHLLNSIGARDLVILMGDLNAKIGGQNEGYEAVMGKHGVGIMNENGEMFAETCVNNNLVIGGSVFPHKTIHKTTWVSPDHVTENQIDHICISKKFRRAMEDVRTRRGADAASDHHLLVGKFKLRLKRHHRAKGQRAKFNIEYLSDAQVAKQFKDTLREKNTELQLEERAGWTIEEEWEHLKAAWSSTCEEALGRRSQKHKEWITPETLNIIQKRRELKEKVNNTRTRAEKAMAQKEYNRCHKEVRQNIRRDKRTQVERLAKEAELAASQRNMKELYNITRKLSGTYRPSNKPITDKNGQLLSTPEEQLERWVEHFKEVLNRPSPTEQPQIPKARTPLKIKCDRPTKTEIKAAIKQQKTGKAAGPDNIPPEALKVDINTSTDMLYSLFGRIWNEEKTPTEWAEGHIVKLPKKGDLRKCNNYRGITLLSVPSKIFNRVILNRLQEAVDKRLRDQQAGFRKDRSCTDHIATLRIIIEQSIEWNTSLYINFIDFEKAFDSLDRATLWQLMDHYGIPTKIINLIKNSYEGTSCKVMHAGQLSQSFDVKTGVKQGCLLSPFLFLLAIDWVMKETTEGRRNGIQWTMWEQLDDLDFADDIVLLSHTQTQMQEKSDTLSQTAIKLGLSPNTAKTQVIKIHTQTINPILMNGTALEEVEAFTYLGSVVDTTGGTDDDIRSRINKARVVFNMLRKIWSANNISTNTKMRIFNSSVKQVMLYGSETWRTTKHTTHRLQTFTNTCLRRILHIWWRDKVRNVDLWERTNQEPIDVQIRKRKWSWIGHTLRKPAKDITRQALRWNPQGKRKQGRPRNSWRRSVETEMSKGGLNWGDLERTAKNRVKWRTFVSGLCTLEEQRA